MLIDVSYFMSGPRHIENVSVAEMPSPQSLAVNEVINGYIKAFQPEFSEYCWYLTLSQAITDCWRANEKGEILQMKLIFQKRRKAPSRDIQYYARGCERSLTSISFIIFFSKHQTPELQPNIRFENITNEYVAPLKETNATHGIA